MRIIRTEISDGFTFFLWRPFLCIFLINLFNTSFWKQIQNSFIIHIHLTFL